MEEFGTEPNGPGLPNSFDATMIALLAMEAAAEATGESIAAAVARVTDPSGTPIFPNVEGLRQARALIGDGESIHYQGGTGAVAFDRYGDVSAPALEWAFTADGTREVAYHSLGEVNAFIETLEQ